MDGPAGRATLGRPARAQLAQEEEIDESPAVDIATVIGSSFATLRRQARAFLGQTDSDAFSLATEWYGHAAWEVRAFAVHLLGGLAARDSRALALLYERCGDDPSWRVNEALAMAFDDYCAALGYEQALPVIRQWLRAPSPNLRRAVSEGLRPWTASKRAYFGHNPLVAIDLLGTLRDDPSRSVQESVGNALRDISRKHPELILATVRAWVGEAPESKARRVIVRHALKHAVKEDPSLREVFER